MPRRDAIDRLIPGNLYKFKEEVVEFSRIGGTGLAVCHPPGDPDMQSSFACNPASLVEVQEDRRIDEILQYVMDEADKSRGELHAGQIQKLKYMIAGYALSAVIDSKIRKEAESVCEEVCDTTKQED